MYLFRWPSERVLELRVRAVCDMVNRNKRAAQREQVSLVYLCSHIFCCCTWVHLRTCVDDLCGVVTNDNSDFFCFRFCLITFQMSTFADARKHPSTFSRRVHSHMSVHGLLEVIRNETATQSTLLALFLNKSEERMLPEGATLESLGLEGGPWYEPIRHTLWYNYSPEFVDCPLLKVDYYFTGRVRVNPFH